jgi:hypothetical protein
MKRALATVKQELVIDHKESIVSSKEGTLVLLALLEGLSFNVLSGDVWFLSMLAALDIAVKKYGIEEDVARDILNKALEVAQRKGKSNPMSNMF